MDARLQTIPFLFVFVSSCLRGLYPWRLGVLAVQFLITITSLARAQATLDHEHIDLSVNFSGALVGTATNPWLLTVRDEDARTEYAGVRQTFPDPLRVILEVPEPARIEVPDDSRYTEFLGPAGTIVWILPQTQDPSLLYAGVSTENKTSQTGWTGIGVSSQFLTRGLPVGIFKNNQVTLSLTAFEGPGDFFLYTTNAFGDPLVSFNTADGLSPADSRIFSPGNHSHFNWAFTEPGDYTIGLRASGTLNAANEFTQSDITEFHFHVVPEPCPLLTLLSGIGAVLSLRRRRPYNPKLARQTRITGTGWQAPQ